jgi:hypothetical protein
MMFLYLNNMRYVPLLLLLLLPGCGVEPHLGGTYTEVPAVITTRHFTATATFINNKTGEKVTVSTSTDSLNRPIKLEGYTLDATFVDTYDTTSTQILKDNEYYETGEYVTSTEGVSPLIKVKLPGQDPKIIQKKDLTKKNKDIAKVNF